MSFVFSFLIAICSTSVNDLKEKGISISGRFCEKTVPQSAFALDKHEEGCALIDDSFN